MRPLLALMTVITISFLRGSPSVHALDTRLDLSQYGHKAWTIRDGLLKSGVRSIAQTPDGYLWLATEFGVVRFDGVRFVPWMPPRGQNLPSTNIRSIAAAHDGTLWIGTLEGLASWNDGRLTQYPELAGHNILTLLEDREGTVWAGAFGIPSGKLCAVAHGAVRCYGDDGSLGQWVWSIYEDSRGALWAGAETGLWRWKPGPPKRFPMKHPVETAQALVETEQRTMLAAADGVWQLAGEKVVDYPLPSPPGQFSPVNILRDPYGGLLIGTVERGLLYANQGKVSLFAQNDGLSGDRVLSMFEDREGNIWVGTAEGLDRFRQLSVSTVSVKQGLSSPTVWSVLGARDGSIWIGTLDGLDRWKDGQVTVYCKRAKTNKGSSRQQSSAFGTHVTEVDDPGLPDNHVGSLFEDAEGRIWASTPSAVVRFEAGRFHPVNEAPTGWVNAITSDSSGGIWISYQDHGLVRLVEDRVVERVPWSKLGGSVASSVVSDPVRGGLWLGFFGGGVLHVKDGQIQGSYDKGRGLGGGRVMGLQLLPDGTILASTEGGLSRIKDGHVITLTTANGLPCDAVHWTVEMSDAFWLYTACGLLRIPRRELDTWAADPRRTIDFTLFDSAEGVRNHALLTGYTPRVSKATDGTLWFAHIESVSVVDPLRLGLNTVPPPVHIEQITADGRDYIVGGGLRLQPRVRDVQIDYTALSLAAPEKMQFRVMLEGQDKEWRVPVNPRYSHYTNLPPGHYVFRAIASNNSGVWNAEGAALDFVIPASWFQMNWFRALCVAAFLALLWVLYQLRLRQLARQFNMRMEERVGERTRIARDLHDTLLQSFHGILLHLQTVSNELPGGDAKEKLGYVIDQAEHAIVEGREAVQGLRTSTVERNDLALAIRTRAEEFASEASRRPDFNVDVEGIPRNLHPILRDEVYRIIAEAMRNAFRHASAKQIEMEIHYDDRQLRVRVRDDGKGIDPQLIDDLGRDGHFGLRGMRERAKLIGGELSVWSELDSGTEVELTVPAARAYLRMPERRRSWLALALKLQSALAGPKAWHVSARNDEKKRKS